MKSIDYANNTIEIYGYTNCLIATECVRYFYKILFENNSVALGEINKYIDKVENIILNKKNYEN